jgi:hypothetical protein
MDVYTEARKIGEKYSVQDLGLIISQPEILPCQFDKNTEFWLKRISLWGKLKITHVDPRTNRKEKLTSAQLLDLLTDTTLLNVFGKWEVDKRDFKSVEIHRSYKDVDGRKYHESIIVDIELDPELTKHWEKT